MGLDPDYEHKELIKKIEAKIKELEIGNNYCYECGIDYQEYARDILEDLMKYT